MADYRRRLLIEQYAENATATLCGDCPHRDGVNSPGRCDLFGKIWHTGRSRKPLRADECIKSEERAESEVRHG